MEKEKIIEFLNKEETYNKVYGIIYSSLLLVQQRILEDDEEPFIAGGSIANVIYNLLYKKQDKPVINDIDIFTFRSQHDTQAIQLGLPWNNFNDENFINNAENGLTSDGYGNIWLGPKGENIRMVKSERRGIINDVLISVGDRRYGWGRTEVIELNQTEYYESLLNNFDLNCCCAGLDRVNKKIIYTDKFIEFLCNDKIEVTSTLTPLNTAIRLNNKTKDLKTNSDLDKEVELLKHEFLNPHKPHYREIGNIWYDKYRKNKKFINKHFIVKKLTPRGDDLMPTPGPEGIVVKKVSYVYWPKKFKINYYFKYNTHQMLNNKSLIKYWDIFVRNKNPKKKHILMDWYYPQQHTADRVLPKGYGEPDGKRLLPPTHFVNKIYKNGLTKFGNWLNNNVITFSGQLELNDICSEWRGHRFYHTKYSYVLNSLNKVENYLDEDFSVSDLKYLETISKSIDSSIFDITIIKGVKNHIKFLKFIRNKIKNETLFHHSNKSLFNILHNHKVLDKLDKLNVDDRIKTLNKLLDNDWIKNRGGDYYGIRKHYFGNHPPTLGYYEGMGNIDEIF